MCDADACGPALYGRVTTSRYLTILTAQLCSRINQCKPAATTFQLIPKSYRQLSPTTTLATRD
jgi:hypothetical protein